MASEPAHPTLALLEELLAVPAPPGREQHLAAIVRQKLDGLGYEHQTDAAGNVVVAVPGTDPDAGDLLLAAHLDEIAMVVTGIDPDGSLRVARSGGLLPHKIGEGPVTIVGDRAPLTGVLSMGSQHGGDRNATAPGWDAVRVITGLGPAALAEAGVRVGSTAVPASERRGPVAFGDPGDPLVGAWTFDDRGGVATLLRLLAALREHRIAPARPTVVAFTTHEEGGCHGAKWLCRRLRPELFVAVDGCPMPSGTDLKLDGRPAAWSMDAYGHSDQGLVRALMRCARSAGTELQLAVLPHAYSDASAAMNAGVAPRVVTFGHVRANSHGFEVLRLSVLDHVLATLVEFVQRPDDPVGRG